MEKFVHVDRCDSTQDLLKEQLTLSPNDELTVSCEFQIHGRGRGEKQWADSSGTICFSINVTPHVVPSFTALEISLIVARFFEEKGQIIKLKWPNDLMNAELKKCGGVLIQTSGSNLLTGIGVNLYYPGEDFGGVYETAFALEKKSWVRELSAFIRSHRYGNTQELVKDWTGRCFHIEKAVKITEADQETNGIFKGLGGYGEALIDTDQGLKHIYNGTLRLV